ncbi:MAG: [Bacteroidales bacterium]|nr:[citrate (pro-3S)-lyase] ligase [Bacteroidales bacterium]
MYTEYEIREVPLRVPRYRKQVEDFLHQNGLRLDEVDYYAGVYSLDGDEMLAGGGLSGNIIKCIAIAGNQRSEGLSNRLVSHLISMARCRGYNNIKIFTKPENRAIFESLSFRLLAEAPKAILMETGTGGLDTYIDYLRKQSNQFEEYGKRMTHPYTGVVVMNANPFTNGHRYLLRQASMQVDTLYVIVVKEDCSLFSYTERKAMIEAGTRDLQNIKVLEGSDYAISATTFPTYFLKQLSDASETQMMLDLDLFARHIATALGATIRFVGSEPSDPLTARYNELMKQQLYPKIEVVEIKRMENPMGPISASNVRAQMQKGNTRMLLMDEVPKTTRPYIIAHMASQALRQELDCTPKPGLVDQCDSGAHTDMDYGLMNISIKALHPYFVKLALLGDSPTLPSFEEIQSIGIEAEKAMLQATGGINTHKGALFSMGLAVVATGRVLRSTDSSMDSPVEIDEGNVINIFQTTLKGLAALFSPAEDTHGGQVVKTYHAKGALATAQEGYPLLFSDWLPFYHSHRNDEFVLHKTLLLIMSQIEDTNILYRTNTETAQHVKYESDKLLNDFSIEGINLMNQAFIGQNISPGGAADMLALTIFIHDMVSAFANPNN